MTDKITIDKRIDGIDDSECVYLQNGTCTVSSGYYKQLKRKEQEIEQLNAKLNKYEKVFKQLVQSFTNNPYIDGELANCYLDIIYNATEGKTNDR